VALTFHKAALAVVAVSSIAAVAAAIRLHRDKDPTEDAALPVDLAGTGLYADWESRTVASSNRPYTPQYPLWTDGAKKRRWIHLPAGSTIDASAADAWDFPVGTKLWKEFSFGRPVETRYMERTASGWRFATYVWSDDGKSAKLAADRGAQASAQIAPNVRHVVPSQADCRVCHGNGRTPVLGFSGLQLSGDRDPGAPHGETPAPGSLDLPALVERGLLAGHRGSTAPRICARTPIERAALGYLHANCGSCHRAEGPLAPLGMVLTASIERCAPESAPALATTLGRASHVAPARVRVAPGDPDASVLFDRMRTRAPAAQMPPLGTQLVDDEALQLVATWIERLGH
jgi:cytochrome c553